MIKEVLVKWRDDPKNEFFTLVEINNDMISDYSEVNDDGIFYVCNDEDEYKKILKNGTEEFTMREAVWKWL